MTQPISMYSTDWCGHCRRLKMQLDEAGIEVREVNIDQERQYEARIVAATGGFRTVPTLQIGARLLVNPTLDQVRVALGDSGD